jgi:hypothetical protein
LAEILCSLCFHGVKPTLPSRDDAYDFESVIGVQLPLREFGRSDRVAVMLDNDAARKKVLRDQELLQRAGELSPHLLAIRDNATAMHEKNPKSEIREAIAAP